MSASTVWSRVLTLPGTLNEMAPWSYLVLFLGASTLMIWRLGALERRGFEGTVLGTLIMPYCSGLSNLIFAYVLGRSSGSGSLVLENCLVNNVTNATLLLGLPALIWPLAILSGKGRPKRPTPGETIHRLNRLSLLLTLLAMLFFTGVLWALAGDGILDFSDGLVLVGVFLFWQIFHVFDVLKDNVRRNRRMPGSVPLELAVILVSGYGVFESVDRMVAWIPRTGSGWLVFDNLGWLSGLLMVIPNALLAFYYARQGRSDVVYSSQIGDGHICIPMAIGLFALFSPIRAVPYLQQGVIVLLCAGAAHLFFVGIWGSLPRWAGAGLTAAYFVFLYTGLIR
jgi:cation:H+ antiporter